MKILHIIHALQKSAGTSLFCVELCRHLQASGHEVYVVCQGVVEYDCCGVIVQKTQNLNQIDFVPDVVHIHGLWDYFMHQSMVWCRKKKFPYIVSLHGCLMPHAVARSGWKKRIVLNLYLKDDLKMAKFLHVTSNLEKVECDKLRLGIRSVVVPLGCDIPALSEKQHPLLRTLLFLSRISPEKGLLNLLHAWRQMDTEGWQLVIAGPDWRGHLSEIEAFVANRKLSNVKFYGPAYGKEKDMLYRSASLFVLPSFTENFSAVVSEALSYSLPVITTKGTPWSELEQEGCGWWIDGSVGMLWDTLVKAMRLSDDERALMGTRGRSLINRKYSWLVVNDQMQAMYGLVCKK